MKPLNSKLIHNKAMHEFTKLFVAFFIFAVIIINPFKCFAIDENYIDPSNWIINDKVTCVSIDKNEKDCKIKGLYKYYIDKENRCIYFYYSVNENSISNDYDDVRINIIMNNSRKNYDFVVNKDGLCENDNIVNMNNQVDIMQYFCISNKNCTCIVGIQLTNSDLFNYDNMFTTGIYINGKYYRNDIKMTLPSANTTTVKNGNSTKQNINNKSDNQNTTKKKTENTTKFHYDKNNVTNTDEKITKFSADENNQIPSYTLSTVTNVDNSNTVNITNQTTNINEIKDNSCYSKSTVLGLSLGGIIGMMGLIFLIMSIVSHSKNK